MIGSTPLRIHLADLVFQYETKEQLLDWMDAQMAYSVDRRSMYETIMFDSTHVAIELCGVGTKEGEAESLAVLRSLKIIAQEYGKIYDPKGEIFRLEEDLNHRLEI